MHHAALSETKLFFIIFSGFPRNPFSDSGIGRDTNHRFHAVEGNYS